MKQKLILSAAFLAVSLNIFAFDVTGNSFKSKFVVTSITVGADVTSINLKSADADRYGNVWVTYNFTSNGVAENQGTWDGFGFGLNNGKLAQGVLKGAWTREGQVLNLISVDDVTDGLNLMQGTLDLVSGELNIEVHQVD